MIHRESYTLHVTCSLFQQETCPGDAMFEVLDVKGRVFERANNSAGIYSMLQGLPAIPPSTERKTIYEDTNTYKVIIHCPGYVKGDLEL
jgi:hypothetical protein